MFFSFLILKSNKFPDNKGGSLLNVEKKSDIFILTVRLLLKTGKNKQKSRQFCRLFIMTLFKKAR